MTENTEQQKIEAKVPTIAPAIIYTPERSLTLSQT